VKRAKAPMQPASQKEFSRGLMSPEIWCLRLRRGQEKKYKVISSNQRHKISSLIPMLSRLISLSIIIVVVLIHGVISIRMQWMNKNQIILWILIVFSRFSLLWISLLLPLEVQVNFNGIILILIMLNRSFNKSLKRNKILLFFNLLKRKSLSLNHLFKTLIRKTL
jgi:hypothetical protein